MTEHDDDLFHARLCDCVDNVLEKRAPFELQELLRATEARRPPCSEDDRRDQVRDLRSATRLTNRTIAAHNALKASRNPPIGLATTWGTGRSVARGGGVSTPEGCAGAEAADGCVSVCPTGAAVCSSASILACRHSANCFVSLLETSCIMPRLNCAACPCTLRSCTTFTRVRPSTVSRVDVTVADAAPLPRCSIPDPLSTMRCAVSSCS